MVYVKSPFQANLLPANLPGSLPHRNPTPMSYDNSLALVRQAVEIGKLTSTAQKNITAWLTEARYAEYAPQVAEMIESGQWQTLDDVFWTVIPSARAVAAGGCTRWDRTRSTIARSARVLRAWPSM
jgi:hypothetical protein